MGPRLMCALPTGRSDPPRTQGSDARIMAYADWNGDYLRTVGDVIVELDRSRWFDTDHSGIRAKLRVDAGLIDNDSLKSLVMNV